MCFYIMKIDFGNDFCLFLETSNFEDVRNIMEIGKKEYCYMEKLEKNYLENCDYIITGQLIDIRDYMDIYFENTELSKYNGITFYYYDELEVYAIKYINTIEEKYIFVKM